MDHSPAASRLTDDPTYERAALRAARAVWRMRSELDLVGAHISLVTGAWTQQESGIGRGVDSFHEYLLKAHLFLGGGEYLAAFHDAYRAAVRVLKRGHW